MAIHRTRISPKTRLIYLKRDFGFGNLPIGAIRRISTGWKPAEDTVEAHPLFLFQLLRIELDILNLTLSPLIRFALTHIPRFGLYSYRSVWSVAIIFPIYRRNHSPPPSVVFPDYLCSPGMLKRTGASLNGVRRVVSHFARPFPAKTPQPTHPLTHQTPPLYHRPAGGIHRPYKYFLFLAFRVSWDF